MRFVLILFSMLTIFSCLQKNRSTSVAVVPRDTTITPDVSFTQLLLDSNVVESFINEQAHEKDLDTKIRNFYNSRNYQYAWFDEDGITEQAQAFWTLHQADDDKMVDSSLLNRDLHTTMNILLNESDTSFSASDQQKTELRLTLHFLIYLNTAFNGKVQPDEMQWHIPRRKIDEVAMLDSFLNSRTTEWKPLNEHFYRLENKMKEYVAIAKKGEWDAIETQKKKLRRGESDSVVALVKKRLQLSGDYDPADSSLLFNDSLQNVIKKLQRSFGQQPSGIIDNSLLKELNIPVSERIKQMKINLERMRWMPEQSKERLIANIPEYKLHVFENNERVMSMDIVVGKEANRTVIFSDMLKYVVFSPYWNVPRSIVRSEIIPAMNKSSNYLQRNNMEITGQSNGLPVVRQKPGKGNALGKVKFIFPNRYNIYFHDTPAKTLFEKQKRAFSHGCIRIQQPFEMAKYLLKNDSAWTDDKINKAMNQATEKWVELKKPVPVFIVYFTSWVDREGLLHFREDIYGHDERMEKHLFE